MDGRSDHPRHRVLLAVLVAWFWSPLAREREEGGRRRRREEDEKGKEKNDATDMVPLVVFKLTQ